MRTGGRVVAALAVVVAVGGCASASGPAASEGGSAGTTPATASVERQAEVAERGAHVMPFDLAATTHRFTDTADGGVQQVTVDDPGDDSQVALIRMHLNHELASFRQGDFSDPQAIHGEGMAGTAELSVAAREGRLEVTARDVDGGSELTYRSDDPAVVAAVHAWFAAQRADHGA